MKQCDKFSSLPYELICIIFEYDSTYHSYFRSNDFKKSIEGGYYTLNPVKTRIETKINKLFAALKSSKQYWENEYLLMDHGLWMFDENHQYEWQNNSDIFNIHWVPMEDGLGFKLLPIDKKYESLDHKDTIIDGFASIDDLYNIRILISTFA